MTKARGLAVQHQGHLNQSYFTINNTLTSHESRLFPYSMTIFCHDKVMNDVFHALDNGDDSLLTLLDISAAFDTAKN